MKTGEIPVLVCLLASVGAPWVASQQLGSIERLAPELDALVPTNAAIERVATGFKWTEGPVWIHAGYLLSQKFQATAFENGRPRKA